MITAMTGRPLTVTAICCCVAALPKLSVAFSVIVSDGVVPSVSLSKARSPFTCVSERPVQRGGRAFTAQSENDRNICAVPLAGPGE